MAENESLHYDSVEIGSLVLRVAPYRRPGLVCNFFTMPGPIAPTASGQPGTVAVPLLWLLSSAVADGIIIGMVTAVL